VAITVAQYLLKQDAAVLHALTTPWWGFAAASSVDRLKERVLRQGGTIDTLGGRDEANAAVVAHGGHKQLWLRARLSDYNTPFKDFVSGEFGLTYPGDAPKGYNIDHLFSKGRTRTAKQEGADGAGIDEEAAGKLPASTMVRMLLVDKYVNKSFGSLMEKTLIGTGNPDRPFRDFTSLQLAKAFSIHPNPGGEGLAQVNAVHIANQFAARGILAALGSTPAAMMGELLSQFEFVKRNA